MTADSNPRLRLIHLNQTQVLLGGAAAILLGGYVFAPGWLNWAGLIRSHPLLSIPCTLSLFVAPAALYVSIRRMTEMGIRRRLVFSTLLSTAAVILIALGVSLWLRNLGS
jgi:hypothetical protein